MKQLLRNLFRILFCSLLAILFSTAAAIPTSAQTSTDQPLRVVTFIEEPWVMKNGNLYYGFHADLWDAIAKEAGLKYQFIVVDHWADMLSMVQSGQADVAIEHHGVNADREKVMDFTHEVFSDGMQVVTLKKNQSLLSAIETLGTPQMLQILALGLLTLILIAHLAWLSERTHSDSDFSRKYFPGIFQALSWAVLTIIGERGLIEKHQWSRWVSAVWLFFILFAVSAFTAQLATTFTLNQLNGSIKDINDLAGKRVGTWENGKQKAYLEEHSISMKLSDHTDELIQWLKDGEVDALLLDVGNAYYFTKNDSSLVLAGPAVKPGSIAYPIIQGDTELLEKINRALLTLRANGTYDLIYKRYFGTTPDTTE